MNGLQANWVERLKNIKLFVMDVDGTLTDAGMYYTADGEVMKRFSTRDGMGITLLHRAGIKTAILTTENSPIVLARAQKLHITNVIIGSRNKRASITELTDHLGISLEETAYIGDDINDANPMKMCGASACPADAVETIRSIAGYICSARGGYGAVREFAEQVLIAQGKPIVLPDSF